MNAPVRPCTRCRDDRGDTLIELLLAVVIIALAAVPLIGALLESIAASAEHRGIATTGTLLESFAETAVSEIETSPLPGTAYTASATPSYRLLSNPSKTSGPAGTTVSVFITGFSSALTVTVGGKHPKPPPAVTPYGTGDARITFEIPTLPAVTTPYPITVTASTGASVSSLSGTGFQVTTTSSPTPGKTPVKTPYAAYEISVVSIKCWTATASEFAVCSSADDGSGLQYLTFKATGPSGGLGTLGVVVRDPNHT
jgi:type II secretory pathway pseudopilin PulG